MVPKKFLVPLSIGLVVIAIGVAGVLYMQRGAHIELQGSILKVRTQPLDEYSTALVADFRFVNPSDYPFLIRRVNVILEDEQGRTAEGMEVAESDADRLFKYYPLLGERFNPSLKMKDQIASKQSADRMVAVRFDFPESQVKSRKRLIIRIEEVDGAVSELVQ
jgi:hypothetical protein